MFKILILMIVLTISNLNGQINFLTPNIGQQNVAVNLEIEIQTDTNYVFVEDSTIHCNYYDLELDTITWQYSHVVAKLLKKNSYNQSDSSKIFPELRGF